MSQDREARLDAGAERLRARSLDPRTAPLQDLEHASLEDASLALAVAETLGGRLSDESAALLRRLEADARTRHDKVLRREIRRSLYRLAQKGIATAPEREHEVVTAKPVATGLEPEGFLSAPDPLGDRLFWILKPRPGGGLLHLNAIVNEPAGLRRSILADVNRKQARSLRADLETRHGFRLVEVDWRYCDWILSEGYERARSRGTVPESSAPYPTLRVQLFTAPPELQPAPIAAFLDPAVVRADEEALASSAKLFEEPDLEWWFLPSPELSPALERYRELRASPIVLDRASQQTRLAEVFGAARTELFSGENATAWRRRLEELAYFFWKTDRREAARRCYAAALAVGERSGKDVPFVEELLRRSFGVFFAREAEKEREEKAGSVIVTPDEVLQERARARGRAEGLAPKLRR